MEGIYYSIPAPAARSSTSVTRQFTGQAGTQGFTALTEVPCATLQAGRTYEMNSGSNPVVLDRVDGTYTLSTSGGDAIITGIVTVTNGTLQSEGENHHTLPSGSTVSFTIPTFENDISIDFPGRARITSASNNLTVNGGSPLTLFEVPPEQPRPVQRNRAQEHRKWRGAMGTGL